MVAMTSILTLRKPGHFTRPVQRDPQNGSSLERSAQRPKLLNFEDLPEWFQDNPHTFSVPTDIIQFLDIFEVARLPAQREP